MDTGEFVASMRFRSPETRVPSQPHLDRIQDFGHQAMLAIFSGDIVEIRHQKQAGDSIVRQGEGGQVRDDALTLLTENPRADEIYLRIFGHQCDILRDQSRLHLSYAEAARKGYGKQPSLTEHNMNLLKMYLRHSSNLVRRMERTSGGIKTPITFPETAQKVEFSNEQLQSNATRLYSYQLELDALIAAQFVLWRHRLPYTALLSPVSFEDAKVQTKRDENNEVRSINMNSDLLIVSNDAAVTIPVQVKTNRVHKIVEQFKPSPYHDSIPVINSHTLGLWRYQNITSKDKKGHAHTERVLLLRSGDIAAALAVVAANRRPFPNTVSEVAHTHETDKGLLFALKEHMPEAEPILDKLLAA